MINDALSQIGLDKKESDVYLNLLKMGGSRASILAYQMNLPRTTAQNILIRLEKEGLVIRLWEKNVATFSPIHPKELIGIIDQKKKKKDREFEKTIEDLKNVMPEMNALMSQNKKIPNVRMYRGEEAARKVLFDTLTSKTELKDFANIDAMFEHVKDINDEYVAEREKTKIKKRSLLLDTPFAREIYESGDYSPKSHTGYKWINSELYPFVVEMNIYDGKVSYLTYVEDDFTGVIIENDHIYQMHDSMWNLLWDSLPIQTQKG